MERKYYSRKKTLTNASTPRHSRQFLAPRSDNPKGGLHGQQATKNGREPFLASRRDDPKGGRQGWQATKKAARSRLSAPPDVPQCRPAMKLATASISLSLML
jgi:hypothetical protein